MAGSYLEQFLESIQTLPCDLIRNLTLIHDLDSKVYDFVDSAEELSSNYIKNANDLNPAQKKLYFNQIMEYMDKAQLLSEDKKELAHQIYNMVDKHIRRLDTELAKFDIELDSQGDDTKDNSNTNTSLKKKRPKSSSNLKEKSIPKFPLNKLHESENENVKKRNIENNPLNGIPKNKTVTTELLDMEVDPNEPLYCICHQVSFGEMVGCDDSDCQIEWFHFACVGLTSKPKGKWYCPQCTIKRKNKQT